MYLVNAGVAENRCALGPVACEEKSNEALEERLLVHAAKAQREDGGFVVVLRSWHDGVSSTVEHAAQALSHEDALERLRGPCGGAPAGLGAWVP